MNVNNAFQKRKKNDSEVASGLGEHLQDILVLTFAAGLVSTPDSVSLTSPYNRALNFVSSIASKRYGMRVSCRES